MASSHSTMISASSIEPGAMAPTFPLLRRKALKKSTRSDIKKNREIDAQRSALASVTSTFLRTSWPMVSHSEKASELWY